MRLKISFIAFFIFLVALPGMMGFAQDTRDTIPLRTTVQDTLIMDGTKVDTSGKNVLALDTALSKRFDPKKAIFRSAVLPGWGQAYNKKYWKIPIVYAALGTSAAVFFSNINTYNELRQAVIYKADNDPSNDLLIRPEWRGARLETLQSFRNSYRQYVDYSALAFLLLWGLNVVDAAVDAHLKAFDVSDDLSIKIKPAYNYQTNTSGVSIVFSLRDKTLPSRRKP